jgi:integrase
MNEVQPIRNKRHINAIKKALSGRDLLLFIIGINSGLRISDILKLRVGDVRDRDYIVVKEQKTGKTKRFAINKAIKDAVKELVPADAPDDEYLFKSRKGGNKPITRVQAYRILNDAAERAGVKDKIGEIGCHTLRKTVGYWAYKNGADLTTIMRMFNHSSQAVTLRYIGVTAEEVDEVYHTLNL